MRCPHCGNETTMFGGGAVMSEQERYYARMRYQAEGMRNQLAGDPWQKPSEYYTLSAWGAGGSGGGASVTNDPTSDSPLPTPVIPDPTAWSQFKALIRGIFQ